MKVNIKMVNDNKDKSLTYKELNKLIKVSLGNNNYHEVINLSYAMIEDRLRTFLDLLYIIDKSKYPYLPVDEIDNIIRPVLGFKEESSKDKVYKISNLSTKLKILKKILKSKLNNPYINDCKNIIDRNIGIKTMLNWIKDVEDWSKVRNEIIHASFNKNLDSLNETLESTSNDAYKLSCEIKKYTNLIKTNKYQVSVRDNWKLIFEKELYENNELVYDYETMLNNEYHVKEYLITRYFSIVDYLSRIEKVDYNKPEEKYEFNCLFCKHKCSIKKEDLLFNLMEPGSIYHCDECYFRYDDIIELNKNYKNISYAESMNELFKDVLIKIIGDNYKKYNNPYKRILDILKEKDEEQYNFFKPFSDEYEEKYSLKKTNIKSIKDPLKKYYYLVEKEYNRDDVEYEEYAFHDASNKANEIIINALKEYKDKDILKDKYDDYFKLLSAYEPYGFINDRGDDGLETIYSYVHEYIPSNLLNDKDFIIRYCTLDERGLSMVPEKFTDDEDVVLAAVKEDGFNLEYASDRLKDNKEIALNSINHYSRAYFGDKFFSPFVYISDRLKRDYEICKTAVKETLYSLEYISRDVLYDDNFTEPFFIEKFNIKYSEFYNKTNDEIINIIKGLKDYTNDDFVYLPNSVKTNKDVALFCYKSYEERYRTNDIYIYLTEKLKEDEDIIKQCLINKVKCDNNYLGINIDDIYNENYINNIKVLRKVLKLDLNDNVRKYIFNKADKNIIEIINKDADEDYDTNVLECCDEDFDENDLPF